MSEPLNTMLNSLDIALLSKVKEIIEKQWGKHIGDIRDIAVGQYYERLSEERYLTGR